MLTPANITHGHILRFKGNIFIWFVILVAYDMLAYWFIN